MSRGNDSRIVCYFDGSCPGNQFGGSRPMRAAFVVGDTKIVRQVPDLSTADGPIRSNNIAAGLEVEFREVPRERNPAGFLLE